MYWDYERCEQYAANNPRKPLIQCEYSLCDGKFEGGFREYWDLIRKYPIVSGRLHLGLRGPVAARETQRALDLRLRRDFNPYDASDNNFCDNGLILPTGARTPHYDEVAFQHQSVLDAPGGPAGREDPGVQRELLPRPVELFADVDAAGRRAGRAVGGY